jgi:hypothetical protein
VGPPPSATPGFDAGPAPYPIDREGIRAAVEATMPEISDCYTDWLRQNPKLAGRMVVGFEIAPDDAGLGAVTSIELLDGGLGQPLMEGCVLNVFQDVRFEMPRGGGRVLVHYPVLFESGEDAG